MEKLICLVQFAIQVNFFIESVLAEHAILYVFAKSLFWFYHRCPIFLIWFRHITYLIPSQLYMILTIFFFNKISIKTLEPICPSSPHLILFISNFLYYENLKAWAASHVGLTVTSSPSPTHRKCDLIIYHFHCDLLHFPNLDLTHDGTNSSSRFATSEDFFIFSFFVF